MHLAEGCLQCKWFAVQRLSQWICCVVDSLSVGQSVQTCFPLIPTEETSILLDRNHHKEASRLVINIFRIIFRIPGYKCIKVKRHRTWGGGGREESERR